MALLCRMVSQLQYRADSTGRIEDHLPREVRNLSGSQASLHREQDDDAVSKRIPSRSANSRRLSIWLVAKIFACLPGIFSVASADDRFTGCDEQCNVRFINGKGLTKVVEQPLGRCPLVSEQQTQVGHRARSELIRSLRWRPRGERAG